VAGLTPDRVTVVDSSGKPLQSMEEKEEKSVTELLHQLTVLVNMKSSSALSLC
jgi:flagellar biosynthesis/type III secretory pathway M-ring protein FliF/YscJ